MHSGLNHSDQLHLKKYRRHPPCSVGNNETFHCFPLHLTGDPTALTNHAVLRVSSPWRHLLHTNDFCVVQGWFSERCRHVETAEVIKTNSPILQMEILRSVVNLSIFCLIIPLRRQKAKTNVLLVPPLTPSTVKENNRSADKTLVLSIGVNVKGPSKRSVYPLKVRVWCVDKAPRGLKRSGLSLWRLLAVHTFVSSALWGGHLGDFSVPFTSVSQMPLLYWISGNFSIK